MPATQCRKEMKRAAEIAGVMAANLIAFKVQAATNGTNSYAL
jgi:hypothetical protein